MLRSVLERYPFADDVVMSEDQEWSRRVLLAGLEIVYEPNAVVRHSHAYSLVSAFRRFFDSGASAKRAYVSDARESRDALRRAGARYALGEVAWLWRTGRRRWLPYAALYESAKYAGLQLGLRHERIPRTVKKRLSGLPAHWETPPSDGKAPAAVRICLVYDHLFPQTVGGAERWMRDLGLHLAATGHEVTYLTMRHWDDETAPRSPDISVIGLSEAGRVYRRERRTLLPPLRFGVAVARHLWRHGSNYDVVHMASFPYFPLLAAGTLGRRRSYRLVVHWIEVWTREYWWHYAGPLVGTVGWLIQRACVRTRHTAYCLSQMHAERLVAEGYRGTPLVLPGLYAGPVEPTPADRLDPALVAVRGAPREGEARRRARPRIRARSRAAARAPARALRRRAGARVHREPRARSSGSRRRSSCAGTGRRTRSRTRSHAPPASSPRPSARATGSSSSRPPREERRASSSRGRRTRPRSSSRTASTASISPDPSPESLAAAIVRVVESGAELRESTADWFAEHARTLRIDRSLELVAAASEPGGVLALSDRSHDQLVVLEDDARRRAASAASG